MAIGSDITPAIPDPVIPPPAPTAWGTVTGSLTDQTDLVSYINTALTGLLDFKGTTDCSANPNYPAASKGDTYTVSVAGKIGGASGTSVDAGDFYVATVDNAGGTEASVGTSWGHIEHNLPALGVLATLTPGTGIATALAINTGSAGAPALFNGAGGTPSSLTLTNATGLPAAGVTGTAVTQTTLSNATLPASVTTLSSTGASSFATAGGNIAIGNATPSYLLHARKDVAGSADIVVENATSTGQATLRARNNSGVDFQAGAAGSTYSTYQNLIANRVFFYSGSSAGIAFNSDAAAGLISFATGGAGERWQITAAGALTATGAMALTTTGAVSVGTLAASGVSTLTGIVIAGAQVRFKGYTVATLPSGTIGDNAYVTDALAPTFLATIVGGGAIKTPVFYDGTNWVGA